MDRAICFELGLPVSNIPFNTIASVLNVGNVQRQGAATQAKRTQDEKQVQQAFKAETERHAEEVEDPGDTAVDKIGEEPDHHNEQKKKKRRKHEEESVLEVTDVAQFSAEAAKAPAVTERPKVPAVPQHKALDISA